uniref:Uncharacterized protein n=1 Tax=Anguilla anguilla TaxID=7936 RepID=A0A0E9W8U8_ANGAN
MCLDLYFFKFPLLWTVFVKINLKKHDIISFRSWNGRLLCFYFPG